MLEPVIWEPDRWIKLGKEKGLEFLEDMQKLWHDPKMTLACVGAKHGITRERVRQLFEAMYRIEYGYVFKQKAGPRQLGVLRDTARQGRPFGKTTKMVADRMAKFGMSAVAYEAPYGKKSLPKSLLVGDKVVVVRACTKPQARYEGVSMYVFITLYGVRDDFDFYVFLALDRGVFLVVPRERVTTKSVYVPEGTWGKLADCVDAWGRILNGPNSEKDNQPTDLVDAHELC